MSGTGATPEQIEAITKWTWERETGAPWDTALPSLQSLYRTTVAEDVRRILPPGYQIVPAGAVVLTAEEAATASYACSIAADAAYEPVEQDEYRALAAKLGGAA